MPETTRRVNVTLTFTTNDVPADVAYSVMAVVRDESRYAHDLETISVHGFDLSEDGEGEPAVQLVVDPCGGITGAWVDNDERAHEFARNTGGVVVELPITADHQGEATAMEPEDVPDEPPATDLAEHQAELRRSLTEVTEFMEGRPAAMVCDAVWARVRPALHEIERRTREQVAREIEETATFDAARSTVDASDGHEDHCEWHLTNGAYCSCRVWPAACAGVSVAALAVRGEAR